MARDVGSSRFENAETYGYRSIVRLSDRVVTCRFASLSLVPTFGTHEPSYRSDCAIHEDPQLTSSRWCRRCLGLNARTSFSVDPEVLPCGAPHRIESNHFGFQPHLESSLKSGWHQQKYSILFQGMLLHLPLSVPH